MAQITYKSDDKVLMTMQAPSVTNKEIRQMIKCAREIFLHIGPMDTYVRVTKAAILSSIAGRPQSDDAFCTEEITIERNNGVLYIG